MDLCPKIKPCSPEIAAKPNPVAIALLARGVDRVYHMTDALNVPSILRTGLLSYNAILRADMRYVDISDPEIQGLRAGKKVFGVTDLHDFVPFYFAWFTKMQRKVESRGKVARDSLVFLEVDVLRLAIYRLSICYTDDNASKRLVEPSNDPAAIDQIDWNAVTEVKHQTTAPTWAIAPSAELLVSRAVPVDAIRRIVCRTSHTAASLEADAQRIPFSPIPVEVDASRYFREPVS